LNDVAGTTRTYGVINLNPGNSINPINVTFGKPYQYPPIVTLTANSDLASQLSAYVVSSSTGFVIYCKNNSTGFISIPTNTQLFSYHIIGIN
jgi:hypothetical protein